MLLVPFQILLYSEQIQKLYSTVCCSLQRKNSVFSCGETGNSYQGENVGSFLWTQPTKMML